MGRFAVREYRDSRKGIKRRVGPVNGLNGGFAFWAIFLPCWPWAQNSCLEAIGGHASGAEYVGSTGTWADALEGIQGAKNRPRLSQGGQLLSDNQVGGRKLQALPIPQSTR